MKFGHTFKAGIALAVTIVAAASAEAAAVSYFGNNPNANGGVIDALGAGLDPANQRNLFRNSLATSRTEAFNMTPGGGSGLTSTLGNLFSAGSGISLTASDASEFSTSRVQNNYNGAGTAWTGRFDTTANLAALPANPVSTSGWFETNRASVSIDFTTAVSAFGTFMTDVGDFRGSLRVDIFSVGGGLLWGSDLISTGVRTAQGGLAFFGYTNDTTQFNRVLFTVVQPTGVPVGQYDFVGFDDFITGTLRGTGGGGGGNVPEPTSLALVGLSLALLGCTRCRRNKA